MRLRLKVSALTLCGALGAAGAAYSQTYSINAHVVATGTSVRSGSACARMRATIGEPVAGYSSSVDYAMVAGFRAIAASATPDDIFFSSFEVCP